MSERASERVSEREGQGGMERVLEKCSVPLSRGTTVRPQPPTQYFRRPYNRHDRPSYKIEGRGLGTSYPRAGTMPLSIWNGGGFREWNVGSERRRACTAG